MWQAIDYEERYFDQMSEMIKEKYGDIEISHKEFLQWQYFNNPAGKAVIKLAYDQQTKKVIGQYVCLPLTIKVNHDQKIAAYTQDILTRKEYRKQQFFTKLGAKIDETCQKESFDFKIIFPNEDTRPNCLKSFQSICRFSILIAMTKRLNITKHVPCNIYPITLKEVKLFDFFWERVKKKYEIIGVRDTAYMKWRYLDIPFHQYSFYGVIKTDVLQGYIVGTIKKIAGIRTGVITDFLVDDDCEIDDVKQLIICILNDFAKEGVLISMAFLPDHSDEYDILKLNGYIKWPQKLEPRLFEVYAMDFKDKGILKEENVFQKEKWFISLGDLLV